MMTAKMTSVETAKSSGNQARSRKTVTAAVLMRRPVTLLILFTVIVFWHTPWAGAPRTDQIVYLHQISQYQSLYDIVTQAPSWHRTHSAGDFILYRPVLYLVLGTQYFLFGYRFTLWQLTGLLFHLGTVLFLYRLFRQTSLPVFWQVLLPMLFSCSFLGSEMVIWNHMTAYVLFALLVMASLNCLLEYFTHAYSVALYGSVLLALLATFTYEGGIIYCVLAGIALGYVNWKEARHVLSPFMFFLIPLVYAVANLADYYSVFEQLPASVTPEKAPPATITILAMLVIKQLGFWFGGLGLPTIYTILSQGRAQFGGFASTASPLVLLNMLALGVAVASIAGLGLRYWRRIDRAGLVRAGLAGSFVLGYAFLIARGRSLPRGLEYTLFANIYYSYLAVLGSFVAVAFLFRTLKPQAMRNDWLALLAAGAIAIIIFCNATSTFTLISGYRQFSEIRIRMIDRIQEWQRVRGSKANAFYTVGDDCYGNDPLPEFAVHARRGSIWKGPFRLADAVMPERSYVLNREWLANARIEVTRIQCGN